MVVKPSVTMLPQDELPLGLKLLAAGTSASFADFTTFPLDTAKVRLQIQGEAKTLTNVGSNMVSAATQTQYRGLFGTIATIVRTEGPLGLFNGLSAGLQRQMCFASVRLGLYETVRDFYTGLAYGNSKDTGLNLVVRIAAGSTTGCLAVLIAQPTDVVKVRFQAQLRAAGTAARYTSTMEAYRTIAVTEGARGLWKGTFANCGRNAIVNVSEIVCYDIIKETIIKNGLMTDNVPCHFTSALAAGFCTTFFASPVDVVKTRFMNSKPGTYTGAINCAVRMFRQEGFSAFYKGFVPSFCRLVSWNIVMWLTYEQVKKFMIEKNQDYKDRVALLYH
ncbi:dicarboxylate carrier SLC25A8-like [Macrosteles quadrilineatus]|uniref:dicarboxylate carrier SLC25A8-like n=1 Tax=Macrosteles quadrilineatus TaxID=74068 RepID=UPI0023E280F0|nr:dicarboxylate carrier SLC25A8-like [Macrosteles quadrilineatus]XP_054278560.1 dicarboxylate carrier SLC25A8-like [Macrosteles quadrilineatus]XP_054278561.1 dicarboxylate carrier SLC25A8-like [Macrosteles quadrilineatus]